MSLLINLIEGILEMALASKKDKPSDNLTSELHVGQIIKDNLLKCEVVDVHKTNIKVKILEIYWDRIGTYLDVGKVYPVFKHSGWKDDSIQVWEIAAKHMKRSSSQVIFQWESDIGWRWDLDS